MEEKTLNDLARECGLGSGDTIHLEAGEVGSWEPDALGGRLAAITAPDGAVVAYAAPGYAAYALRALRDAPGLENDNRSKERYIEHLTLQLKYAKQGAPQRVAVSLAASTNVQVAEMANQALGHPTPHLPGRVLSSIHSFAAQPVVDTSQYPLGRWVAFVVYDTGQAVAAFKEEG